MCKCLECGEKFKASRDHEQLFCSSACRSTWNNRRKSRGAEVYDLFMTMRFDRANAEGVWAVMCRMASEWNAEDKEANRRSFGPVKKVMERNVRYRAVRGRC